MIHLRNISACIVALSSLCTVSSCIEPPLHLPAEEVLVEIPKVLTELEVVWDIEVDWKTQWHYGWDELDKKLWGGLTYPEPTNFEVRRYYLGEQPSVPHTDADSITVFGNHFRRPFEFGYYDMLLWSNIDSKNQTQVLTIDESDLNEVHASTTISHGMSRVATRSECSNFNIVTGVNYNTSLVTGLFNPPEAFYAAYPQNVYISRYKEDYDYYDETEHCWVKKIDCVLMPRVYIYLVQVIIKNNRSRRIKETSGNCAVSNLAAGTSVNSGHTWNMPVVVHFPSRMKHEIDFEGEKADIIGGKLTTFGLCDMPAYEQSRSPHYSGSRKELRNDLYVDIVFSNGAQQTLQIDVTDQVQQQAHGGVITVVIDANEIPDPPSPDPGSGSLFVPTVEDYDEIIYDIVM